MCSIWTFILPHTCITVNDIYVRNVARFSPSFREIIPHVRTVDTPENPDHRDECHFRRVFAGQNCGLMSGRRNQPGLPPSTQREYNRLGQIYHLPNGLITVL
jgi:hypothetical protein